MSFFKRTAPSAPPEVNPNICRLLVYRPKASLGSGNKAVVTIDGVEVARVKSGEVKYIDTVAGPHHIEVSIVAGQTTSKDTVINPSDALKIISKISKCEFEIVPQAYAATEISR